MLHFADLVNRHDFIDNIVRHADPGAFEMSVCTMGRPSNIEEPAYEDSGIPHWTIGATTRSKYPSAAVRLAALLHRQQIDVVHAHHYEPCVVAAGATLMRPRTKLVVGRHYSDAIYLHTAGVRRRAMLRIEGLVNRRASLVIAPSQQIATLLVDRQGVPVAKVAVIPYAFEPARFACLGAQRLEVQPNGSFTIGTFGRLYSDKGHRFLLEALPAVLRSIPDLKYLIVGEGEERRRLEQQVRDLDLGDVVTFLGWRHDVAEVMAAVDLVVQPSLQEAFSQSMAEALLLGRPLVITDVSGAEELVESTDTGVVVPCRDSSALARAIVDLHADPTRRATIAEAGRQHAQSTISIDAVVPRYEAAYRSTVGLARTGTQPLDAPHRVRPTAAGRAKVVAIHRRQGR